MKKVISLLLVAMLVFAMATTAFAANAGETVTFTFKTSGNAGFGSYNAVIEYDSSALKLVEIKEGKLTAGKGTFLGNPDTAKVGYFGLVDVTGDGALFTAVFEVLDAAAAGDYKISAYIVPGSSSNIAGEESNFTVTGGGSVEVECDHAWGEWAVKEAATCDKEGTESRFCSKCNKEETRKIDKVAHTWGEWEETKAATCTKAGKEARECSVCGETESRNIAKLGHKYKNNVCVRCGHKKTTGKDPVHDTGDITGVVTMGVVAMISVVAAAAYVTKRRITK